MRMRLGFIFLLMVAFASYSLANDCSLNEYSVRQSVRQSGKQSVSQADSFKAHRLATPPAAEPYASPNEAESFNEKATEYALTEKEKREPFYSLYQNEKLETVCFEGTIRATSTIPDPEKNDYDNCLYALFVDVDSILSSNTVSENLPCEVLIDVPILKDKKVIAANQFLPGDMVSCICAEYDAMPQSIQEIQLSDDIQSFEHQQYYVLTIKKIEKFSTTGNKNFAKREITILPIQSLPKDEKAAKLRKERIQSEIARIEAELKNHGGTFENWKEEYKPIAEKYKQLCKENYKGWIHDSYFAATGVESTYKTKEYIEGILPYKKYLEENNIDLLVVRIPSKADFAARVLAADDFQENPAWMEHYYECLKNDIEIIDPMPEMWKHRFDLPLFYYFNDDKEGHPFEATHYYAAHSVSSALSRYDYNKEEMALQIQRVTDTGEEKKRFYPQGNSKYKSENNIEYYQVIQNDKPVSTQRLLSNGTKSPFVFISNSFFGRHLNNYVGLPVYVSYFLQTIPDWIYQDGNTGLLQDLISRPYLLNHRRAVVMVGHPSFWVAPALFPKYYSDHARTITFSKEIKPNQIVFTSSNNYVLSVDESGIKAKKNPSPYLRFDLNIPVVPGKTTCMIRISFNESQFNVLKLIDSSSDEIIDQVETPAKSTPSFVYLTIEVPESKQARIEITPIYENIIFFDIKSIELWYY